MFPYDIAGVIYSMRQVYYKLKDIEADIEMYRKMRAQTRLSTDRQAITKEISYLEGQVKKLKYKNKSNRAFTHGGIPICPTRKTKPKSAERCPVLEQFLKDQKTEKETKLIKQKK
jgi:hypothetical protein